ncbi:MAG: pyridoxine 5'-phosphate synthase [Phycisphaerae bacterium]|nr:pyridoxine 5'-phosphate synthase [Phycisphaerae bacterium]
MPDLCVNIDHVATVRQARRTWEPDPAWAAVEAQLGGAHGITFHLREDRRHIQDDDLRKLKGLTDTRLNMEMAATTEMLGIAIELQPQMAMLVPEGRDEITTEGGLDVVGRIDELRPIVHALKGAGIPVSAFIDAEPDQISAAADCGFNVCELHTGPYAECFHEYGRAIEAPAVMEELERVSKASRLVLETGMRCNAGHGLNYANVAPIAGIPGLSELHIGHSIISRSIFVGVREATREMIRRMASAHSI